MVVARPEARVPEARSLCMGRGSVLNGGAGRRARSGGAWVVMLAIALAGVASGNVIGAGAQGGERASGGVVELSRHAETGVVSAWLGNGVRVHVLSMPGAGEVRVAAMLAGGLLGESGDGRGSAALLSTAALGRAAHGQMPVDAVDAALGQRGVRVTSSVLADAIRLDMGGPTGELGWMLDLLSSVVREPRVDAGSARAWRQAAETVRAKGGAEPRLRLREAVRAALGEDRAAHLGTLTDGDADVARAQACAERLVTRAPMEVVIVTPGAWGEALGHAERALGGLAARARIGPSVAIAPGRAHEAVGELAVRAVATGSRANAGARPELGFGAAAGEHAAAREGVGLGMVGVSRVERLAGSDRAAVLVGFAAPGAERLDELRAMTLARLVLEERLRDRLLTEVGEGRAWAWISLTPGGADGAKGMFAVVATGPSDRAEAMTALAQAELIRFASHGATPGELERAKRRVDEQLGSQLATARGVADRLCGVTFRGQRIEDAMGVREHYRRVRVEDTRRAVHDWMSRGILGETGEGARGSGLLVVQVIGVDGE